MKMRTTGLLLLLFQLAALVSPSLSQLTLEPNPQFGSPVIIPNNEAIALSSNTFIACVITDPSDPPTLETRWIHPNGITITHGSDSRFVVTQGNIGLLSGDLPATILLILMLSYEDAGTYSCEVRNESDPNGPWYSSELELQLLVNLHVVNDSITVDTSVETVELHCEMFDYIRPDSDLQWFSSGNVIINGTNQRTITYIDGTLDTAANGGGSLVPSRVAVLTITNPQVSDSGTYTCRVRGAGVSTDVQLTVTGTPVNIQFADSEPREISLGPDPVMSLQTLSCTLTQPLVDYSWQWSFNGDLLAQGKVLQNDGTRNSIIAIPRLSADDAGVYQCQASSPFGTGTQNITMNLTGVLVSSGDVVFSQLHQSVNLTCELYGYLGETSSTEINWQLGNVPIDSSLITTEQGTRMIQNGGDSPIPSVRSVLTLQNLTNDMFGTYICTNGDFVKIMDLDMRSETPTAPSPGSSISAVIGGVVGSMIVALITVMVVVA